MPPFCRAYRMQLACIIGWVHYSYKTIQVLAGIVNRHSDVHSFGSQAFIFLPVHILFMEGLPYSAYDDKYLLPLLGQ